jgi:hypothetical protein
MNKKLLFAVFLGCAFFTTVHPMLQLPTSFKIKTALNKISASNIQRTSLSLASSLASIKMFYKAFESWAQASTTFPLDLQSMPNKEAMTFIEERRNKAALRYLLAGSAFAVTAALITYWPEILRKFQAAHS